MYNEDFPQQALSAPEQDYTDDDRLSRPDAVQDLLDLAAMTNIADEGDLSEEQLTQIGTRVVEKFQIDKDSRADREPLMDKAMKLALQTVEPKNYPWPDAANIKYPLITKAAVDFAARAYPAIIRDGEVVKVKVIGAGSPEQLQTKKDRARRQSIHMNWQLTEEMPEWEEGVDQLLHCVAVTGCMFKKTYYDNILKRPVSDIIFPEDLVVHKMAKSLERDVATHVYKLHPREIEERIRSGLFLKFDYQNATTNEEHDQKDKQAPIDFLEQHTWWDLDDDGYEEPYIITVVRETGKVVRIRARFEEPDIVLDDAGGIIKIHGTQFFTKYGLIPAFDGSFYDLGFGDLLFGLNESLNTTLNQLVDSAHLSILGGGFVSQALRMKKGEVRMRPGEFKTVHSTGMLSDNILPINHPPPSRCCFSFSGSCWRPARIWPACRTSSPERSTPTRLPSPAWPSWRRAFSSSRASTSACIASCARS